jgi:Phage integrase, N-terminal SAM-like domain
MRRDPRTGAPDFFGFARDYLHAYMPRARGLSPKTIEAYRISLECFLDYLAEAEHIRREHVSFDHFERPHLKGWLAWMTEQRHYTPKTVTLRLSAVKAFLTYAAYENLTLVALSQSKPKDSRRQRLPAGPSSTSLNLKHGRSSPHSPHGSKRSETRFTPIRTGERLSGHDRRQADALRRVRPGWLSRHCDTCRQPGRRSLWPFSALLAGTELRLIFETRVTHRTDTR